MDKKTDIVVVAVSRALSQACRVLRPYLHTELRTVHAHVWNAERPSLIFLPAEPLFLLCCGTLRAKLSSWYRWGADCGASGNCSDPTACTGGLHLATLAHFLPASKHARLVVTQWENSTQSRSWSQLQRLFFCVSTLEDRQRMETRPSKGTA
jgi:hypothetical protein